MAGDLVITCKIHERLDGLDKKKMFPLAKESETRELSFRINNVLVGTKLRGNYFPPTAMKGSHYIQSTDRSIDF